MVNMNIAVADDTLCSERTVAVQTAEGVVCVCTQGFSGENCQKGKQACAS